MVLEGHCRKKGFSFLVPSGLLGSSLICGFSCSQLLQCRQLYPAPISCTAWPSASIGQHWPPEIPIGPFGRRVSPGRYLLMKRFCQHPRGEFPAGSAHVAPEGLLCHSVTHGQAYFKSGSHLCLVGGGVGVGSFLSVLISDLWLMVSS